MNLKTISQTRRKKKECDWDNWKKSYDIRACLNYDDCKGCGAFNKRGEKG